TGMGPTTIHTATVGLNLYDSLPSQTQLLSPPDGASGVSRRPVLLWSAAGQVGASYHLEIASDLGFTNLVYTATLNSTGGQPTTDLEPRTVYYWRVQAENACGVGSVSSIFRFTTAPTDFTLAAYPANQSICAPADAVYDVTLSGLSDPVTLDVAGYPPGATAAFDPNPVNTPGSSELTISNTGAATPGVYALQITGITPTATHTTTVQLSLATALPGSPTLLWPPDEGLNQPLRPTFTWSAADQAEIYTIEIATDVAFTDIVDVATVSAVTTYQPTGYLHSGTTYYWRVRSVNSCGSSDSAVFRLTTGNGTFMVNSPADAVDANPGDNLCATAAGFCTLRAAIQEANAAPASQEEMIIILPSGVYTLTLAGANEDSAAFGDLDISGYYAIVHEGVEASEVFGNGAVTGDRVFHVLASAEVTLVGLTIRGGVAENGAGIYNSGWLLVTESTLSDNDATGAVPAGGGGAYNNGTLLLNNVLLASNSSSGYGGGVYTYGGELSSDGVLTITNSVIEGNVAQDGGGVTIATDLAAVTIQATTIEGNAAVGNGGGLALRSGAVHVTDSAVHGNAATYGGGIQQNGNELHVTNSTISGNSATESGGGLEHAGTCCTFDRSLVWLNNVTMTENSALNNGGFYNSWGTTYLENTLVAGNSAASSPDCRNPYTFTLLSNDYNLLGNDEGCPMTSAEHDQIGTPDDPIDPLLGPLQGNGGPTLTHALLAGSPAIEAGNPAGCPDTQGNFLITDQRGYPRPEDGDGDGEAICDVGAYEASGPDFALLANPSSQGICLPGSATYTISALSIAGYHEPVSLTTSSLPAEATATFAPNPVIAGEESLLTIEAFLNATAGDYDVPVVGTVPDRTRTTTVTLGLYDALPTAPLLLAPADGSTEQPPLITFEWAASNQAGSYSLEIARDSAFLDIVESATGLLTTYYTISAPLDTHTLYYWRVRAQNSCGLGDYSAAFSFTTGDVWNRTFVVNSLADGVDVFLGDQVCAAAGGICTLRAAIQEANALNDDEPVLILLPAGDLTLTIAGEEEDSAATGDLDVTANVSIVGLGADSTIIHGNGAVTGDRVFHILASVQATISSVAIVDGVSAVNGGGVYNSGVLTITGSTLQTNVATFNGGGVYSDGTLVMADSALWGNTALGNSGGALFLPSGEANTTIINSTISGNTAAYGGGIFHELGNLTLIYSTVTNNQSTSEGGGIYYRQLGSLVLQGTILAGNIATTGADCRTISRNMSSAGYNIVGSLHGCIFTAGEGDQLGTYFDPLDPLLGPLQNNGGPTLTHALLESSPAIDMGDPIDCLATDQRGVARPQGFRCDVGAYELESTAAPVCSAPGLAIPDHDPAGVTDDLVLTGTSSVVDLNVQLVVTHPFVGDLIFTLTHVDTGTAVTLMDRPGFPPPPPCNGDNIDATLDDEGTGAVEDACSATPPTISGFLIPSEPLSAFDGEATAGTWRLTAVDNGLGSLGTLDSWCVEVTEE
ncbi:MAG: choice-of-anchor Q domain-containing protein, partial [Chloroflexota bacterium]